MIMKKKRINLIHSLIWMKFLIKTIPVHFWLSLNCILKVFKNKKMKHKLLKALVIKIPYKKAIPYIKDLYLQN